MKLEICPYISKTQLHTMLQVLVWSSVWRKRRLIETSFFVVGRSHLLFTSLCRIWSPQRSHCVFGLPLSHIHCPWRLTKSMAMSSIRMLHWHLYYVLKYILIYFLGTFPCRCVGASFVDSYFIFCWPPIFVV